MTQLEEIGIAHIRTGLDIIKYLAHLMPLSAAVNIDLSHLREINKATARQNILMGVHILYSAIEKRREAGCWGESDDKTTLVNHISQALIHLLKDLSHPIKAVQELSSQLEAIK